METDYNIWHKRIRLALKMTSAHVVDACRHGGLDVSLSRVDGWRRSPEDGRKHRMMTRDEFEGFTAGLPKWAMVTFRSTPEGDG